LISNGVGSLMKLHLADFCFFYAAGFTELPFFPAFILRMQAFIHFSPAFIHLFHFGLFRFVALRLINSIPKRRSYEKKSQISDIIIDLSGIGIRYFGTDLYQNQRFVLQ
jgi:hypothetical protein